MARVTGPLFSVDASGTVAGAVVFSRWKGRPYVRKHAIPGNPKSQKQVSVRSALRFLAQMWDGLEAPSKASWSELADATKISTFNAYIQHNMRLHRSMLPFTQAMPAAGTSTAPSAPTLLGIGGVRSAQLVITPGINPALWGWIVFRNAGEPDGLFSEIVGIIEADGANNVTFVDTPLIAGNYYYAAVGFNGDMVAGDLSNAEGPVAVLDA